LVLLPKNPLVDLREAKSVPSKDLHANQLVRNRAWKSGEATVKEIDTPDARGRPGVLEVILISNEIELLG
jgi:hypothetical protein